jgi:hypothetical protein
LARVLPFFLPLATFLPNHHQPLAKVHFLGGLLYFARVAALAAAKVCIRGGMLQALAICVGISSAPILFSFHTPHGSARRDATLERPENQALQDANADKVLWLSLL